MAYFDSNDEIRRMNDTTGAGKFYEAAVDCGSAMINDGEDKVSEELFQREFCLWRAIAQANKNTVAVYHSPEGDRNILIGIRPDGTVLLAGNGAEELQSRFAAWTEIVAVDCAKDYAMGLRADGTVLVASLLPEESEPPFSTEDWLEVIAIACGEVCALGLSADGMLYSSDEDEYSPEEITGSVYYDEEEKVFDIACGGEMVAGLCGNSRAYVKGSKLYYTFDEYAKYAAVCCGAQQVAFLSPDGRVYVERKDEDEQYAADEWRNVVSVACGDRHIVGILADGSVAAAGENTYGQCNVTGWKRIVAVYCGNQCTVGLKEDGSIVMAGVGEELARELSGAGTFRVVINRPNPEGNDITAELYKKRVDLLRAYTGENGTKERLLFWDFMTAEHYFVQMLDELDLKKEELTGLNYPLGREPGYAGAYLFGTEEYRKELESYNDAIRQKNAKRRQRIEAERERREQKESSCYVQASEFAAQNEIYKAAVAYGKCSGFLDAKQKAEEYWKKLLKYNQSVAFGGGAAGKGHIAAIRADGTVVAAGANDDGQCETEDWTDIIGVYCPEDNIVGLRADGTVVVAGKDDANIYDAEKWTDIVALAVSEMGTILGLHADGTVVASGIDAESYSEDFKDWAKITEIGMTDYTVFGLAEDGHVEHSGEKCFSEVDSWEDIVSIACGGYHAVGLKSDGTVVAAGENDYGQCEVKDWTDIVAVFCDDMFCTYGIKSDGTVVATGGNRVSARDYNNVIDFSDVMRVAYGSALRTDGTLQAGFDGTGDWTELVFMASTDSFCNKRMTVGLKADGTLLVHEEAPKDGDEEEDEETNEDVSGVNKDGHKRFYEFLPEEWTNLRVLLTEEAIDALEAHKKEAREAYHAKAAAAQEAEAGAGAATAETSTAAAAPAYSADTTAANPVPVPEETPAYTAESTEPQTSAPTPEAAYSADTTVTYVADTTATPQAAPDTTAAPNPAPVPDPVPSQTAASGTGSLISDETKEKIMQGLNAGKEGLQKGLSVGKEGLQKGLSVGKEGVQKGISVGKEKFGSLLSKFKKDK